MTALLVRHARAGRRDRWEGDDRLRPLTKRGRAQAAALVDALRAFTTPDVELFSSPWVRCLQTLEPLSHALGVAVDVDDVLGEGMGSKAAEAVTTWLRPTTVLLCSHGDVIEDVLVNLSESGVALGARPWAAKGSVWVLHGTNGVVERAEYIHPE